MVSRLLQDHGGLRDPGALKTASPPPPAPGVLWPKPRAPRPSALPARLAQHAHEAARAETRARAGAAAKRWPWSAPNTREAEGLATQAATAALLQDAAATLKAELRTANARIERLEQALEGRNAALVAALLDRLLAARLERVGQDARDGRRALDDRVDMLETALEERLSWLELELDALEVRVRSGPRPQDRSPADPAG